MLANPVLPAVMFASTGVGARLCEGMQYAATGAKTQPASQRNIASMPKTLVFTDLMCYTQFAFDAASGINDTIDP